MRLRTRARYVPADDTAVRAAQLVVPVMDRLGERIVVNAKARANVRTGAMRRSIRHRTRRVGTRVRLRVSANTYYSRWVHDGTRPHIIRARRAPFLVFYWPKVGRVVYFKKVNHPGYKGNPYLRDAVEEELGKGVQR